jgi:hypothetical protein
LARNLWRRQRGTRQRDATGETTEWEVVVATTQLSVKGTLVSINVHDPEKPLLFVLGNELGILYLGMIPQWCPNHRHAEMTKQNDTDIGPLKSLGLYVRLLKAFTKAIGQNILGTEHPRLPFLAPWTLKCYLPDSWAVVLVAP